MQAVKPKVTWKQVTDITVKIEREHREGENVNVPLGSYRLTYEDKRHWKRPKIQIESIYLSELLHDFGHLLLALTNDVHHNGQEA